MPVVVTGRPEREVFDEYPPSLLDEAVYISRWNACEQPIQYTFQSNYRPNTVSPTNSITSVSSFNGYAQINLASTLENYVKYDWIEVTGTTNYDGVYQIRKVVSSTELVVSKAYVATDTGTTRRYFQNYNVLVRVLVGRPTYSTEDPGLEVFGDPIRINYFDADGNCSCDIRGLLKDRLSLDWTGDENDLNAWIAFRIQFAEEFDVSDGFAVTRDASEWEDDRLEGCESEPGELFVDPEFANGITDWEQTNTADALTVEFASWVGAGPGVTGECGYPGLTNIRITQVLYQDVSPLIVGREYKIRVDIEDADPSQVSTICQVWVTTQTDPLTVISQLAQFQVSTSGVNNGVQEFTFIAPSPWVRFAVRAFPYTGVRPSTEDVTLNEFSLTLKDQGAYNYGDDPCVPVFFATMGSKQIGDIYAGNMAPYIGNVLKPGSFMNGRKVWPGEQTTLDIIVPAFALPDDGSDLFIRRKQYDTNNVLLDETTHAVIVFANQDSFLRVQIGDLARESDTDYEIYTLERQPQNRMEDGDGGTFATGPFSSWGITGGSDLLLTDGGGYLDIQSTDIPIEIVFATTKADVSFAQIYTAFDSEGFEVYWNSDGTSHGTPTVYDTRDAVGVGNTYDQYNSVATTGRTGTHVVIRVKPSVFRGMTSSGNNLTGTFPSEAINACLATCVGAASGNRFVGLEFTEGGFTSMAPLVGEMQDLYFPSSVTQAEIDLSGVTLREVGSIGGGGRSDFRFSLANVSTRIRLPMVANDHLYGCEYYGFSGNSATIDIVWQSFASATWSVINLDFGPQNPITANSSDAPIMPTTWSLGGGGGPIRNKFYGTYGYVDLTGYTGPYRPLNCQVGATEAQIDQILLDIENNTTGWPNAGSGTLDFRGNNAIPSAAGTTSAANIAARGYTVLVNS